MRGGPAKVVQLVDALAGEDMRLQIRQDKPATLRDALSTALELESYVSTCQQAESMARERGLAGGGLPCVRSSRCLSPRVEMSCSSWWNPSDLSQRIIHVYCLKCGHTLMSCATTGLVCNCKWYNHIIHANNDSIMSGAGVLMCRCHKTYCVVHYSG